MAVNSTWAVFVTVRSNVTVARGRPAGGSDGRAPFDQLYVCDLDGTLLRSDATLSARAERSLSSMLDAGRSSPSRVRRRTRVTASGGSSGCAA
jgi:hypothetical protein